MTLATLTSRNTYPLAGSAGPYAFTFRIFSAADLVVTYRDAAGVEHLYVLNADYSITGVGNASGSITLLAAVPPASGSLTLRRSPSQTQNTSLRNQGQYFPATVEDELDYLTMLVQALEDKVDRALGLTESYDPAGVSTKIAPGAAGSVLGWTSPTQLGNLPLVGAGFAIPGGRRTVATATAYVLNNAVFNVRDYGAVGDGVTNDTAAIAACYADAAAAAAIGQGGDPQTTGAGALVEWPSGRYVTDEIKIAENGITSIGQGKGVHILARAANQTIVRLCASYCRFEGFTLAANGHLGVRGFAMVPQDEVQAVTLVYQNFNVVQDLLILDCVLGVHMRCGPSPGGDSQCFYNSLFDVSCINCQEGLRLDTASGGGNSPVNANFFWNFRAGTVGGGFAGYGNCGINIVAGQTNNFFSPSLEGILLGVAPCAVPTALRIGVPASPSENRFFGLRIEACTQDIDCSDGSTYFIGIQASYAKSVGTAPGGGVALSAQVSNFPMTLPGMSYGEIGGFPNAGAWGLGKPLVVPQVSTQKTTEVVANGANTAGLAIPLRTPILVVATSNVNALQSLWLACMGDGVGNINAQIIFDGTGGTLSAVTTHTLVKIHNGTGVNGNVSVGVFPMIADALA